MKEAIILEKSEYKCLTDRIEYLESRVDSLEYENENLRWDISVSSYAYEEIRELKNTIWELRNRADIDAFNKASDDEFNAWCNNVAKYYNINYSRKSDFEEWIVETAKLYNTYKQDINDYYHIDAILSHEEFNYRQDMMRYKRLAEYNYFEIGRGTIAFQQHQREFILAKCDFGNLYCIIFPFVLLPRLYFDNYTKLASFLDYHHATIRTINPEFDI